VTVSGIASSVVAQYDATAASATGTVSSITDQVGSAALSGSAEVISSGINSKQTFRFDGSSTAQMTHSTTLATTDPFAIIFVAQQQEPSGSNSAYVDGGSGFEFAFQDNNKTAQRGYRGSTTGHDFGGSVDQNPHIFVLEGVNGSDIRLRKDGSTVGTVNASTSDLTGLKLGGFAGQTNLNLAVDFGQVEVTEGHTASELNSIEQRLANKWGITI